MAFQGASPVLFESVSAVTATPSIDVGTRRVDGGNHYVYVYNAGNSAINMGYAAVMSGVSGYSVTVSAITQVDFGIGICKNATMATATYGWLLTKGFSYFNTGANDSCSTGANLAVGVDGVIVYKTICTGYMSPVVGKATLTGTSGTSLTGFGFFNFD